MKYFFTALAFLCCMNLVVAQSHHTHRKHHKSYQFNKYHRNWGSQFKVGAGHTRIDQDFKAKNYFAELEHSFNRFLSVAPSVTYSFTGNDFNLHHWRNDYRTEMQPEALTTDLNVYFSPLRTRRTAVKIGGGWSRRFDAATTDHDAFDHLEWKDGVRGRNVVVGIDRRYGNLILGVRRHTQKYDDRDRFSNWNVGVGFRM